MKRNQQKSLLLLAIPLIIYFLCSNFVSPMEIVENCFEYSYEQIDMCTQCKSGYYLFEPQNSCIPCPNQCSACLDAFACSDCEHGILPSGRCISFDLNCKVRLSNGDCDKCYLGYYLSKNYDCLPC